MAQPIKGQRPGRNPVPARRFADTATSQANAVSAALAWTEDADVATIAATAAVSASASWTEGADTAVIAVSVAASATLSWTEEADTTTAAGVVVVSGAAGWTEASDTAAVVGSVVSDVSGTLAWTEDDDPAALVGIGGSNAAGGYRRLIVDGKLYRVREREIPALLEQLLREETQETAQQEEAESPQEQKSELVELPAARVERVRVALNTAGLSRYFSQLDAIYERLLEEEDEIEALLMVL